MSKAKNANDKKMKDIKESPMSFHKIAPVKKAAKPAPAPKKAPKKPLGKPLGAPKRRPVTHKG